MIQTRLIQKLATGQVLFKDDAGEIIQTRIDSEPIGLTGELYPESITVGEGENTYSFVTPSNGGITLQPVSGSPTVFTGNAQALLAELTADFFTNTLGSGGGGGGGATENKQDEQLARQGTITDSPATNPNGSATQIALEKGIFGNGLKYKSLELVIEEGTSVEYCRAVDFDPNTPPAVITYIDPLTGLVTTPPLNPAYPVVRTLPPVAAQQQLALVDLETLTAYTPTQDFRYIKIERVTHTDLGISIQPLTIDIFGVTRNLWDGEVYEFPLLPYPNFYLAGNLTIAKSANVVAYLTIINA